MHSGSPPRARVRNHENTVILAYARIHLKAHSRQWIPDRVPYGRVRNDDICCRALRDTTPAVDDGFVFTACPWLFGSTLRFSSSLRAEPMLERSFLFQKNEAG
jgi:hypothetical protein